MINSGEIFRKLQEKPKKVIMMTSNEILGYAVVSIIVLIGLFLLMREVNCWYFKINKLIDIQEKQLNNLRLIREALAPDAKENQKDDKTSNQGK